MNSINDQPNTRPRYGLVRCPEYFGEHAFYDIVVDALNERETQRRFFAGRD